MRRTLILLAFLVAGFGRAGGAEPVGADRHQIVAGDDRPAAALARPASPLLSWVSPDGTGPVPRSAASRADLPTAGSRLRSDLAARQLAFEARAAHHRRYAGALALARAGFHAFHTSTPPPFPLI